VTIVPGTIKLLVLDVDGVLTDGRLYYTAEGEALKVFHVRDGHGIKSLLAAGIAVAIISGRSSTALERRARELGITHIQQGVDDKGTALQSLITELGLSTKQCACLVDDTPDLPMMAIVGLPVAVADAHPRVLAAARLVTRLPGGTGAVRELADLILGGR
jgi:3-deoxy-D-manno-octulosonate 8-phosphate phosphatase (KDO 8-P phosphatase)